MKLPFPEVRVGEPMCCGEMTVFPLFAEPSAGISLDYLLAYEAMAAGTLTVREVSEEGSVSELLVENGGDRPVLFLEGEEMKGASRTGVLCSSVLVGGRSRTTIPVACVERGRWEYETRHFARGSCCPPTLRHVLKQWQRCAISGRLVGQAVALGVYSAEASADGRARVRGTCPTRWTRTGTGWKTCGETCPVPRARRESPSPSAARSCRRDLFDKPATLQKLWDRLVARDRRRCPGDLHDQVPNERNGRIGRAV